MSDEATAGPFVCTECALGFDEEGDCPSCREEPLIDARTEDVRELLGDLDRQEHEKMKWRLLWIFGALGAAVGAAAGLAVVSIGGKQFVKAGSVVFVGSVGAGAFVASALTRRRFRPRFNRWAHYVTPTEEFAPDYGKKR